MIAHPEIHWRSLLPLLILAALSTGLYLLGRPAWILPLGTLALLLHLLVMPRLARRRGALLDRVLLSCLQRGRPELLMAHFHRAWLVRLYAPAWHLAGKEAWIRMGLEENELAEKLYAAALLQAPEPERSTFLANLAVVKERLGKREDAHRIRERLAQRRPDLADYLGSG